MTYSGRIKNGVVVLDEDPRLPEGTVVRIELVECGVSDGNGSGLFRAAEHAKPTGMSDLAVNHDHYLYGHPKVDHG